MYLFAKIIVVLLLRFSILLSISLLREKLGHLAKRSSLDLGLEMLASALLVLEKVLSLHAFVAQTPHPTIADIVMAVEIYHFRILPRPPQPVSIHLDAMSIVVEGKIEPSAVLDISGAYPKVDEWVRRIRKLDYFDRVHEDFSAVEANVHAPRPIAKL